MYRAKARFRAAGVGAACGIMACSRDVIGPDSLGSVDTVPVRAATTSSGKDRVRAKTVPATPISIRRAVYSLLRPIRSPRVPTASEVTANPASIAVNTRPTFASE